MSKSKNRSSKNQNKSGSVSAEKKSIIDSFEETLHSHSQQVQSMDRGLVPKKRNKWFLSIISLGSAFLTIISVILLLNYLFTYAMVISERALRGLQSDPSYGLFGFHFTSQMEGAFTALAIVAMYPIYRWWYKVFIGVADFFVDLRNETMGDVFKKTIPYLLISLGKFLLKATVAFIALSIIVPVLSSYAVSTSAEILNNVSGGKSLSAEALVEFTKGTSIAIALVIFGVLLALSFYGLSGKVGRWIYTNLKKLTESHSERMKRRGVEPQTALESTKDAWKNRRFFKKNVSHKEAVAHHE